MKISYITKVLSNALIRCLKKLSRRTDNDIDDKCVDYIGTLFYGPDYENAYEKSAYTKVLSYVTMKLATLLSKRSDSQIDDKILGKLGDSVYGEEWEMEDDMGVNEFIDDLKVDKKEGGDIK